MRVTVTDKSSGSEDLPLRSAREFYRQCVRIRKPPDILPGHIRLVRAAMHFMYAGKDGQLDDVLLRCIENKDWEGLAWVLQHINDNIPGRDIYFAD